MTTEEFSNEFDVLVNSYATVEQFGAIQNPLNFNEYEKSVFLTKAQETVVHNLYTGNLTGESFEDSEQNRRYLDALVKTDTLTCNKLDKGLSANSYIVNLPQDTWFITYESVNYNTEDKCYKDKEIDVVPIAQDEYARLKENPFRGANSRRVLRLDIGQLQVELISDKYQIKNYLVRYIARPEPIILTNLPEDLGFEHRNTKITQINECKLNPGIHRMILDTAVNMAIRSRVQGTGK